MSMENLVIIIEEYELTNANQTLLGARNWSNCLNIINSYCTILQRRKVGHGELHTWVVK